MKWQHKRLVHYIRNEWALVLVMEWSRWCKYRNVLYTRCHAFWLEMWYFTEVILWCGVVCIRTEINVQDRNEGGGDNQSIGELYHHCLAIIRPLMNCSISPSRTKFKSDNWLPVLRSWTNFWGPNVYLRVSRLHISFIACLFIIFMSDTPNSLANKRSFAFNLLVAFSLFAK